MKVFIVVIIALVVYMIISSAIVRSFASEYLEFKNSVFGIYNNYRFFKEKNDVKRADSTYEELKKSYVRYEELWERKQTLSRKMNILMVLGNDISAVSDIRKIDAATELLEQIFGSVGIGFDDDCLPEA